MHPFDSLLVLLFLPVFWKHSSSQSISVSSALEALVTMRYIDLRFRPTLHYITLQTWQGMGTGQTTVW